MYARLAQRLEHRICNAMVIGSTPIAGFFSIDFSMIDNLSYAFLQMLDHRSIYYVIVTYNYESKMDWDN